MPKKKQINIEVGERLKAIRKFQGRTQEELAAKFNVEPGQYAKLENGFHGLNAEKLMILHNDFKIDPTYLITGKDPHIEDMKTYLEVCTDEDKEALKEIMAEYMKRYIKISFFSDENEDTGMSK